MRAAPLADMGPAKRASDPAGVFTHRVMNNRPDDTPRQADMLPGGVSVALSTMRRTPGMLAMSLDIARRVAADR